MRAMDVVRRPVITEKAMASRELSNRYVFEVAVAASKPVIRKAVEELFKVKVATVHTLIQHGRFRRMGKNRTRIANWKKAVVTLEAGQKIEMLETK